MSSLEELARAVGIQVEWADATGQPKRVGDEALVRVLEALGCHAGSEEALAASLDRCREEAAKLTFISADQGQGIQLPAFLAGARIEIQLEGGEMFARTVEADGTLPALEQTGYHRLRFADRELTLAIAPPRCFGVEEIAPGKRLWGPAVQVPALRANNSEPFGDFGTLADATRQFASRGADVLAISPVHALFPADASRYSPYGPSSRTFLNVLFACCEETPDLPVDELIDWASAIPHRVAALHRQFERRTADIEAAFRSWREQQGDDLARQATFDALHAHFLAQGAYGWQQWPQEFHDPESAAVRQFAQTHADEVSFYAYAQWRAAHDLDAAQREALANGMAIGLIADLAVGIDPGGAQAWSAQDQMLHGLSVGAPPDVLGPQGQNWGLTSFSPDGLRRSGFAGFIAMVRAALRHAGGLRIDHILGLNRLWIIPHGSPSADGAYLTYPLDDLLRILAIESHRARGIVIGEDLGTVPHGLRPKLRERNVSGMRVLWFERGHDGGYIPPADWDDSAVAMTGTHDTFTVAGWWTGRDIDWNRKLGRGPSEGPEVEEREEREHERWRLWDALSHQGAAHGPRPGSAEPRAIVDAACRQVASTPCPLAIFPMEDIAGLVEQPNLPGTIDEHPNWRRRMPCPTGELLDRADVAERLDIIRKTRS